MASLEDLKNVLRETLEQKGVLGEIKAKIRAEVFTALDSENAGKPQLSNENMIVNEMIKEYLEYNGYYNSASVLVAESGSPAEPPFDKEYLRKKFSISNNRTSKNVPLLYGILTTNSSEIIFGLRPEMGEEMETSAAFDRENYASMNKSEPRAMSFKK